MAITFGGMFHFKIREQGVSITSKEYTNFLTETINKFNLGQEQINSMGASSFTT